jgi:hypothetical protein
MLLASCNVTRRQQQQASQHSTQRSSNYCVSQENTRTSLLATLLSWDSREQRSSRAI